MNIHVKCEKCNTLFAINVDNITFNKEKQKLKCTKCNHIWYHTFNLHALNKSFHDLNTDDKHQTTNKKNNTTNAIENDTLSQNITKENDVKDSSHNIEKNFHKIKIERNQHLPVNINNSDTKSNESNFTLLTLIIILFTTLISQNNKYFNQLLSKDFRVKIENASTIENEKAILLQYTISNKLTRDIKIPPTRIDLIDDNYNIINTLFDINNDKIIKGNDKIQLTKKITNIETDKINKIEILTGNMIDFILY